MKLKKSNEDSFEQKMDMTPLIDCIFQLILFLVLTSQITIQTEDVDLPFALEGKEAKPGESEVPPLIVNVVRERMPEKKGQRMGYIVYGGNRVDGKKLAQELKREAAYAAGPKPGGRGRGYDTAGAGGVNLSKLAVLVRADRGVQSQYIRTVFESCMQAGIWRLKVSTVQPD